MKVLTTIALLIATHWTADIAAQTQLVRGGVDGIRNTAGLFQLDCTQIRLISSTVNLQQLHDQSRQNDVEFEMQVLVSSTAPLMLDVVSATPIIEQFDMGNLRFGRSDSWSVFGVPGAPVAVYLGARQTTRFVPAGPWGTWIMGADAFPLRQGMMDGLGRFLFNFQMPNAPALVGVEFSAQAITVDANGAPTITNPDCKDVRSN